MFYILFKVVHRYSDFVTLHSSLEVWNDFLEVTAFIIYSSLLHAVFTRCFKESFSSFFDHMLNPKPFNKFFLSKTVSRNIHQLVQALLSNDLVTSSSEIKRLYSSH